jgi:hypothetical protein
MSACGDYSNSKIGSTRGHEGVATMRKSITVLFLIAVCSLLVGVGQAAGAAHHASAVKSLRIVMSDPGCHWFSVGGKLKTNVSVKGPVAVVNLDIGTLEFARHGVVRRDGIGKTITLARGSYRITMVDMAADDNTLKLVVR